jgi:acetoin utilization deacetylase AcuC-like enzyme
MAWVYNPLSSESAVSQLYTNWQTEEYINEINQCTEASANRVIQEINYGTRVTSAATRDAAILMAGSIEKVNETIIREMARQTEAITNEISQLTDIIDIKINLVN